MPTDQPERAPITIIRGDNVFRFDKYEQIPAWLVKEANAALREARATVTFGGVR